MKIHARRRAFGLTLLASGLLIAGLALALAQAASPISSPTVTLTEQNYEAWRDHILPQDVEWEFQQIPWLPSYAAGLTEAARQEKPLLLWTMNGHPLGCT